MVDTTDFQCVENIKEGHSVQFENKMYRVQNDKGWLYIYPNIKGKRKKKDVKSLLFEAGTIADYIFNGWWGIYNSFELYKQYTKTELNWLK